MVDGARGEPTGAPATAGIRADVEAALARRGLCVRGLEGLSGSAAHRRGRGAWRVALADGSALKARRLESAEAARALHRLRDAVDPAFAPVLAREGAVLLEAWVEGAPLSGDGEDAEARAQEAGALLGRLHATRPPDPGAGTCADAVLDTRGWRESALAELARLEALALLAAPEARALRDVLLRHDPGTAPTALLHRDYCAENMVVDRGGRLHVVDNEWLLVGAAGFDLGRTRSRWPLSAGAWARFLRGYRDHAPHDPGPLRFWEVVGGVWSAARRLDAPPARRAAPLTALRRLLEEG